MHHDRYSNRELSEIKRAINEEILRRGTFSWWDPLTTPSVGQDRVPPLSLPEEGKRMSVNERTYTINTSSDGSLERTRNVTHPAHGDNPGGVDDEAPDSSAGTLSADEMRNYLIGLSKIQDIPLFYGRDEVAGIAFRDLKGVRNVLRAAQESELNRPLHETDHEHGKRNRDGNLVTYQMEEGRYVMPAGGYDGEETLKSGPDETNFFDDHGASIVDTGEVTLDGQPILVSDHNYHPFNPNTSEVMRREWNDQDRGRKSVTRKFEEGGEPSSRFGPNPRNPQRGNQFKARPVFGGVLGACNVACTGLCYQTCDNECSESCTTTCWNSCGDACTSNCGNICTGCTTMCYTSCKTKCQDTQGFSCLQAGAKTVEITAHGKAFGETNGYPKNTLSYTRYSCLGCAYTCQFWPNKRTECWDAACQQLCFTSCRTYCSTSCFGGCVDNQSENSDYKTGIGRACSAGCTINCVGACLGICEGECVQNCWHACKQLCWDNCEWKCHTNCGSGCADRCKNGCTGCDLTCTGFCKDTANSRICQGCSNNGGCSSTCQHDCNQNCIGWGCRSICGTESGGACEANCRMSCVSASCSAMCGEACSSRCTTCVNTCGHQCGPCTSQCSIGCGAACNITCTDECRHSCTTFCYFSCTDECGGCSNLCYSCVGMCIGVCSVKCDNGCSSCSLNCGWWCDQFCGRGCFSNCSDRCIQNCSGSCATFLMSQANQKTNAERVPTSVGYKHPNPKNREEEQESFRLFGRKGEDPNQPITDPDEKYTKTYLIEVFIDELRNIQVVGPNELEWLVKAITAIGGVYTVEDDEIQINEESLRSIIMQGDFYKKFNPQLYEYGDGMFIVIIKDNLKEPIDLIEDIRVTLPFEFHSSIPIKGSDDEIYILIARTDFGIDDPLRTK